MDELFDEGLHALRVHIERETRAVTDDVGDVRQRADRQRRHRRQVAVTALSGALAVVLILGVAFAQGSRQGAEEVLVGDAGGAGGPLPGTTVVIDESTTTTEAPAPTTTLLGGAPAPSVPPISTTIVVPTSPTTRGGTSTTTAGPPATPPATAAPTTTLITPTTWPVQYRDPSGAYPCDNGTIDPEYSGNSQAEGGRRMMWVRFRNLGASPCWMEGFVTASLDNFENTIHAPFVPQGTPDPRVIVPVGGSATVTLVHDMHARTPANCPSPAPIRYLSTAQSPFFAFRDGIIWEDGGPGADSGWCATDTFTSWTLLDG